MKILKKIVLSFLFISIIYLSCKERKSEEVIPVLIGGFKFEIPSSYKIIYHNEDSISGQIFKKDSLMADVITGYFPAEMLNRKDSMFSSKQRNFVVKKKISRTKYNHNSLYCYILDITDKTTLIDVRFKGIVINAIDLNESELQEFERILKKVNRY